MTSIIELRGISKLYKVGKKEVRALNNISFNLEGEPAKIITVAGESGSGKTTLASIMLGLIKPSTGKVAYQGKDIQHLTSTEHKEFRKNVTSLVHSEVGVVGYIAEGVWGKVHL